MKECGRVNVDEVVWQWVGLLRAQGYEGLDRGTCPFQVNTDPIVL